MPSIDDKVPWTRTPLIRSAVLSKAAGCNIYLKLENLQPSGSFKSRGIGNFIRSHLAAAADIPKSTAFNGPTKAIHFFCSSGGNAGLGCVHAAVVLGCPATIVVPLSTTDYMIAKLRAAGAEEVIQYGASWYEADRHLVQDVLPAAKEKGEEAVYVPPFDAPEVWTGNATMVKEIFEQMEDVDKHYASTTFTQESRHSSRPDAIICSVGGGGLFSGIMQGLDELEQLETQVVAAETLGADSLAQAVEQGELITLPAITSIATSLGASRVCQRAFEYGMQKKRVSCVVLSDAEAVKACKKFADDERTLVEPACAVSIALCYNGRLKEVVRNYSEASRVVVVVCGGSNLSLDMMGAYVKKFC